MTARCRISPATSASVPIRRWSPRRKEADLILAIGTRLGEPVTQGYTLLDMAGGVPIVHVYPEAGEIGRVFRPALGIVADLNAFATAVAAKEPLRASWNGAKTEKPRYEPLGCYPHRLMPQPHESHP